jgi:pyridoxal phosphate enzyme (YggS family)
MDHIRKNWEELRERIERAAAKAGRDPGAIEVVAVSKTRSAAEVEAAYHCGLRIVGENRIQEAAVKRPAVQAPLAWHLVGHLQTNKAGRAIEFFDLVQSVDSERLARALDRRAAQAGRVLDVLLQVNTSGNEGQSGVAPAALVDLVASTAPLDHVRIRGLMTIGAHSEDEGVVRSSFRALRELGEHIEQDEFEGVSMDYLSMGMSGDFAWAIAEGANLLRLGTAIFGSRLT